MQPPHTSVSLQVCSCAATPPGLSLIPNIMTLTLFCISPHEFLGQEHFALTTQQEGSCWEGLGWNFMTNRLLPTARLLPTPEALLLFPQSGVESGCVLSPSVYVSVGF